MSEQVVEAQRFQASKISGRMGRRRGRGAPVRHAFLMANNAAKSPMSDLLSGKNAPRGGGGRGGRTRVGLYLTLLWVLAGQGTDDVAPHSSSRPWRLWAQLVGLDDPADAGARAARAAARELADRGFILHEPVGNSRDSAVLTLLREDRSGARYEIPNPMENEGDRYFRVPEAFWTRGLLARLTGPELAMYLLALDLHRTDQPENPLTFSQSFVSDVYGLGDSSRRKGLAGLARDDILWVAKEPQDAAGSQLGRLSARNTYVITPNWRPPEPQRRESDAFD